MALENGEAKNPHEFTTLASLSRAKVGFQFYHRGYLPACERCQLFFVCQQPLRKYQAYEIVEVRPKQHTCPNNFHEEPMQVVRVEKLAKHVAMPKRGSFHGVTVVYQDRVCYAFECPHRQACVSTVVIREGEKIKIKDIVKDISPECRMGYQLVLVDYDPVS